MDAKTVTGVWEKQTEKYGNGENYRIGKVIVASAFFSAMASKDDPKKYAINVDLPCFKKVTELFETLDEAKARAERAVRSWFSWLDPEAPTTHREGKQG